MGVGVQCLL
uniref:Uncharacterized protein n=1 Tax=Anguilla anguilla TaxID=7936 RepID=A0A0E9V7Z5_ANGAN